jgi:hypothetical protein
MKVKGLNLNLGASCSLASCRSYPPAPDPHAPLLSAYPRSSCAAPTRPHPSTARPLSSSLGHRPRSGHHWRLMPPPPWVLNTRPPRRPVGHRPCLEWADAWLDRPLPRPSWRPSTTAPPLLPWAQRELPRPESLPDASCPNGSVSCPGPPPATGHRTIDVELLRLNPPPHWTYKNSMKFVDVLM